VLACKVPPDLHGGCDAFVLHSHLPETDHCPLRPLQGGKRTRFNDAHDRLLQSIVDQLLVLLEHVWQRHLLHSFRVHSILEQQQFETLNIWDEHTHGLAFV